MWSVGRATGALLTLCPKQKTGDNVDTATSIAAPDAPPESPKWRETVFTWLRFAARLAISAAVSLTVVALLWRDRPAGLTGEWDIVGYPTFTGYDHRTPFLAYRLGVLLLPFLFIVVYLVLSAWGPLRHRRAGHREEIRLREPDTPAPAPAMSARSLVGLAARLGSPALFLTVTFGATDFPSPLTGIAAGLAYVVAVLAAGLGWERGPADLRVERIGMVNGMAAATVAFLGVWLASQDTRVFQQGGAVTLHPWMPLWLAVVGAALTVGWMIRRWRRGDDRRSVERIVLVAVLGGATVFLLMSKLPYLDRGFEGFDDAQGLAGASLLDRGHFPWRDLLFIHGFYPDVLSAKVGLWVFGDSIWGAVAGASVLLVPLGWVFLYLLAVWVSRANPWFATGTAFVILSELLPMELRFVFVPLTAILLGATLRRRSPWWCAGLVIALFAHAVLVPETSFFAIPALVCVVAADLIHRQPGVRLWHALARTRWCVITGLVALAAFAVFLLLNDALRSFIDYYVIFGPGHNLAGALPLSGHNELSFDDHAAWGIGIVFVLLSAGLVVVKIRRRSDWTVNDWLIVAYAGFMAFYEEKALGRFDPWHILQVLTAATPLILLWAWKLLSTIELTVTVNRWAPAIRAGAVPAAFTALAVSMANGLFPAVEAYPLRHRVYLPWTTSDEPRLRYASTELIDADQLHDLDRILRHYAGADEPVFDMTNSLGHVYYLLGRKPGTRFAHVSMAIPSHPQQMLIEELKRSRPPVVILDSTKMGLPVWDRISNNVRHYEVSQYVMDNWVPVVRTGLALIMVRPDLVSKGLPPLTGPVKTDDLWFSGRACDWGYAAGYLRSVPSDPKVELAVTPVGPRTHMEVLGWAADLTTGKVAKEVVVVSGQKVVARATPSLERLDVVQAHGKAFWYSGFRISTVLGDPATTSIYMITEDGKAYPMEGRNAATGAFTLPEGGAVQIEQTRRGFVDNVYTNPVLVQQIELKPGMRLSGFALATMSSSGAPLGAGRITIADDMVSDGRAINVDAFATQGRSVAVRLGACHQWHGYSPGKPLYLVQHGAVPITKVTLSGVVPNSP